MRNSSWRRSLVPSLAVVALGLVAPALLAPLRAQALAFGQSQHAVVLQAGRWYADVDGMIVGTLRAELPLDGTGRWLLALGVMYAHYTLGSPVPRVDLLAPEALVHLQLGRGRLRPYVGGGAGLVLVNMFHTVDPVLSLAAGLRADLSRDWGARFELDTRAFGQFDAGTVGWSFGLVRRF